MGMDYKTDDLRIREIKELVAPVDLLGEFSITRSAAEIVWQTRQEVHKILHGADDRLLVIIGPCSIHDVQAAKDFAQRLVGLGLESKKRGGDGDRGWIGIRLVGAALMWTKLR